MARGLVRAVNLRHERLEHGRAGRHLGNRYARTELRRDGRDLRTDPLGDVVALRLALLFADEVDLNVRDVRSAPQEVVAHEAVEIERRRGAHVNLVVRDFGFRSHSGGDFPRDLGGALQRAALGHVKNDLELRLVVERQHLHLHPAQADRRHRREEQAADAREEGPPPAAVREQRPHHAAVEAGEGVFWVLGVQVWLLAFRASRHAFGELRIFLPPPQHPHRRPRRDDERNRQRPAHRRARANRNRPHVWPHQPADERHRQHRADDREGREDGWVAHFADGLDRDVAPVAALVLRQVEVPDNVLDDDDGVVHEDADAEDEREERDAVQREAVEVEDQQCERERRRNGHRHNARLAPAQREPDEHGHPGHGDKHVQQQLVGFLGGGLAVVSSDGDPHIARDDGALEQLDFAQHILGDGDGVRTGPLRDGERDGGLLNGTAAEEDVVRRLLRAVQHVGDFAEVNGLPAEHAHHHVAHVLRALQECACLDDDGLVARREFAGAILAVRLPQHRHEAGGGEVARSEFRGVEQHADFAARAADERGFRHERHLLHRVVHLRHEPAQGQVVVARAVKREREDGHVVNAPGLDERPRDAVRDAVEVRAQLLGEPREARVRVGADLEARDDE